MLRPCLHPGCETLTLGPLCLQHEPSREPRRFPRGRPYPPERRRPAVHQPVQVLALVEEEESAGVVLLEGAG